MYRSLEDICRKAEEQRIPFWKAVQLEDCNESGINEDESFARMKKMYQEMRNSRKDYDPKRKSASGMVGGQAELLHKAREKGKLIVGDFIADVMENALAVGENNACMRRIVAAPTAGACGVLPAVLLAVQKRNGYTDDQMAEALYVSGGIGGVIAARASLAGASGGCQAEIGSASGMAAGALAYLLGGNNQMICHACALALKGLLGLVCDPVAGLVEVPCVKRNVIGSVNAVTSCEMALAGITSRIPPDQVIDAMGAVGRSLPSSLRETAQGGLAVTPEGIKIAKKMKM